MKSLFFILISLPYLSYSNEVLEFNPVIIRFIDSNLDDEVFESWIELSKNQFSDCEIHFVPKIVNQKLRKIKSSMFHKLNQGGLRDAFWEYGKKDLISFAKETKRKYKSKTRVLIGQSFDGSLGMSYPLFPKKERDKKKYRLNSATIGVNDIYHRFDFLKVNTLEFLKSYTILSHELGHLLGLSHIDLEEIDFKKETQNIMRQTQHEQFIKPSRFNKSQCSTMRRNLKKINQM